MKKFLVVSTIVVGIISSFAFLPWIIIYIGLLFSPTPDLPKIKYGEFPFYLEYSLNGKINKINNVVICEFDGIEINEGQGKVRKWKQSIGDSRQSDVLIFEGVVNDENIMLYFDVGSAAVYMGDLEVGNGNIYNEEYIPQPYLVVDCGDGTYESGVVTSEELYKKYGIDLKLIDFNLSKSIVNEFK